MSNVIDFLERMGQDAQLRHADGSQVAAALAGTTMDATAQLAILSRNQTALENMLGAKSNLCCMVYPVDGTH